MLQCETRYFYTLDEIIDNAFISEGFNFDNLEGPAFGDLFGESMTWVSSAIPEADVDTEGNFLDKVWKLVLYRYGNEYILSDYLITDTSNFTTYTYNRLLRKIFYIMNKYYFSFKTIFDAYATETNMLKKIISSSTGSARHNDTPQNGGDYSDDDHTSDIVQTIGTTETEGSSPIMRIDELQEKMRNIISDFVQKFDSLFIEEANIQ
jgi:hypothetical protein